MRVIVDGYNFCFRNQGRAPWRGCRTLEEQRAATERLLRHYAESTQSQVTVVFDSRHPLPGLPPKETRGRLTVLYSTPSADDQTVDILKQTRAPAEVLVVTSDRGLAERTRRFGARSMTSEDFVEYLDGKLTPPADHPADEPRGKYHGLSKEEADFWLDVFGDIDDEEEA